jgi:hypothetical protein
MSIKNTPTLFQKHGHNAEGGHEFNRIMTLLLIAEGRRLGYKVLTSSDVSGDFKGVDCIWQEKSKNGNETNIGFQFKFFPPTLTNGNKTKIKSSLKKALVAYPEMNEWILVIPCDLNKRDMQWYQDLAKEHEFELSLLELAEAFSKKQLVKKYLSMSYIGHSNITEMALRHPHIGMEFFDELFTKYKNALGLTRISLDTVNTNWKPAAKNTYFLRPALSDDRISSEIIFDFQFVNNSASIQHLQQVNVHIKKLWTKIKGIKPKDVLRSSGHIDIKLDLSKKINTFSLNDLIGGPMIFEKNKSKRFGIKLCDFLKQTGHNMATLSFEFIFDDMKIKSDAVTLDF